MSRRVFAASSMLSSISGLFRLGTGLPSPGPERTPDLPPVGKGACWLTARPPVHETLKRLWEWCLHCVAERQERLLVWSIVVIVGPEYLQELPEQWTLGALN